MLDAEDAVALSLLPRRWRLKALDALAHPPAPGTVEAVLAAVVSDRPVGQLAARLRRLARAALEAARRAGIRAIAWGERDYPPLLAAVADAPLALWSRGDPALLRRPAVAIVGSRAATRYGLEAARRLAGDLAAAGALVVSGMARGIDSASHRAALAAGGPTAAVLGSGVDVIYPPEHRQLAGEIARGGVVLSEFTPGSAPLAFHFPARNRIISGLSLATIVVEAAERSGSLITAGFALEQGRAVMAVPGSILSGRHRGCHALIRDGAAVVESAEDVLAELRASPLRSLAEGTAEAAGAAADRGAGGGAGGEAGAATGASTEPGAGESILAAMAPGEAYDTDALAGLTGQGPARLLSSLLELELRGAIRRVDGGKFVRSGRTC
jgi:DNA processing protein